MKYILGAYSQLPFGYPDEEYELLLTRQLKPFLTMLFSQPALKAVLRIGNSEIEWFEAVHPEINMLIGDLCKKGQLELLTSCCYDTALSMLPPHERTKHIEKTTAFLRKKFGKKPRGLWCVYQDFSSSVIQQMEISTLDYVVISPYLQIGNCSFAAKPFVMSEFGKKTVIFPIDDRFSREVADFSRNKEDKDEFFSSIEKIAKSTSNAISTVMINMDQLSFCSDSDKVFKVICDTLGSNCVLPSEYLNDNRTIKNGYMPSGIYGRDYSFGKAASLRQIVIDSPMLLKNNSSFNVLMEFTKDLKKKSDERKIIENLFMKASSSSMYIPDFTGFPAVRRFSHSGICEIEKILTSETSFQLPLCADVDGDGHEEYIVPSKNSVCFLSPRGASVTRFNITGSLQDIAFHNGEGIFSDSFVKMSEHKPVTLSSKYFEISCLDKKRHDFFAKSPQFELNRIPVILLKHFKFRTNTVICEIEIENIGHVEIKDYTYESRLNFAFPKDMKFICSETERTVNDEFTSDCQTVQTVSQNTGLSLGIILNEIMNMSVKPVIHSVKGLESFYDIYQYSQMKIQKQLTIKPGESVHIAIGLRIDKRKETK